MANVASTSAIRHSPSNIPHVFTLSNNHTLNGPNTITGTHDGDLMGTPPSGKDVAFTGITISRCRHGRIAEEWEITDVVGLLGQVGALPAPHLAI